ncbi:MAG: RrF2 family transcriptional regulator [Acidobacteriota bacterium]
MMLYRRSTQLAVQATLLLALEPEGSSRRLRELAKDLGVATTYLTKVFQSLTRVGLVCAVRGPGGGVQLARPAREIRMWDVVSAIEPPGEFERCFLGLGACSDSNPCPLHETWAPLRTHVLQMLQTRSLWEFASEAERKGLLRSQETRAGAVASRTARERQR